MSLHLSTPLPLPLAALATLDWLIVAAYGLLVIGVAWWSKRRQKTSDDYLLGGGRLPWWLVGMSIIATAFSSISLVTWTGYAYYQGPALMQLQLGELAAILIVISVFLPFFARLDITTAYEFLGRRFGRGARWLASAVFHIAVLARGGLFLFLTAQVLAVFTGLNVPACILIVGAAAMLYSSIGGLGAVVWTDGVQMLLVVGGVGAALTLVVGELPGGLGDVWAVVTDPERPAPYNVDPSLTAHPTLLSSILAYGVLALAVGGTNQQAVQRYLACEDLRASRRAALLSWAVGALVTALTFGLGLALFAQLGAQEDLALNQGKPVIDQVFATFVAGHLPVGLAGVLAAALFAASMSSIDSAIHSMATATLVDFVEPLRESPLEDGARLRLARRLTLLYGCLAIVAAFIAWMQGSDVFSLLIRWLGYLLGPVLGLFLLGFLGSWVRQWQALLGVALAYAVLVLGFTTLVLSSQGAEGTVISLASANGVHPIWAAFVGCAVTMGVALPLAAVIGGRKARTSA